MTAAAAKARCGAGVGCPTPERRIAPAIKPPPPCPSAAAECQRRYRARRRDGLGVLPVAVDLVRLEIMLLDLNKIDPAQADDRTALRAAVEKLIGDMLDAYEAALR